MVDDDGDTTILFDLWFSDRERRKMSMYTAPKRKARKQAVQYLLRAGQISFTEYHLALLPLYEKN